LPTKNLALLHSENGSQIEDNVEEKEREFVFFQQSIINKLFNGNQIEFFLRLNLEKKNF